jgi:hypothetical protein
MKKGESEIIYGQCSCLEIIQTLAKESLGLREFKQNRVGCV